MKLLSTLIGSIVMAEPETPFLFESNSGIRGRGSCKARQERIEANPDVPMISSCPKGEEILLTKFQNGNFLYDHDVYNNFKATWNTVNPDFHHTLACKFYKLLTIDSALRTFSIEKPRVSKNQLYMFRR